MTIITVSTNPAIGSWETSTTTADLVVAGVTLSGTAAAAYHFGKALGSVKYKGLLDGVQLTDGTFEFPPASGQWVSLSEVADALHYKYGVDPLIEFAPGLGLRGYSVTDINKVLQQLNDEFSDRFSLPLLDSATVQGTTQATFDAEKAVAHSSATYNAPAVASLLDAASAVSTAPATEAELRQNLTEGGDLYVDRAGRFYINGVPTTAMDVAVVSRLLVQDNISGEYKALMDQYAERNNLIAEARTVIGAGLGGLGSAVSSLSQTYGVDDVLSQLTAGQYSDAMLYLTTDTTANKVTFANDPGWPTGTLVQVGVSAGGLTAGTNYYVFRLGGGAYSFGSSPAGPIVDLTGKVWNDVYAPDAVPTALAGNIVTTPLSLTPEYAAGSALMDYDLMAHVRYNEIGSVDKMKWLTFGPIDPGFDEDTALEFTSDWGDVGAGKDSYVARMYSWDGAMPSDFNNRKYLWQEPNGTFIGYQLTPNASGINSSAFDDSNRATNWPQGSVSLFDSSDTPGSLSFQGYTQFSLPGTDLPTGTVFQPDHDVDLLATYTMSGKTYYKSVVSLHAGWTYFLRNDGGGKYSVYDSFDHASAGGDTGRFYFAIDASTSFTGSGTQWPWISNQTAVVSGIAGCTLSVSSPTVRTTALSFSQDPGWSSGTAVQTRSSGGGLTAGVTYYVQRLAAGQYSFYTHQWNPLSGVTLTEPLPDNLFLANPVDLKPFDASAYGKVTALLNTLISDKVRDGDLDQAKLQTLTAQIQNNTEAMTAMIKVFSDLNASLAQALR